MISVYDINEDMKLFPPDAVIIEGSGNGNDCKEIEGVDTLIRTFHVSLRCVAPECLASFPHDAVCLHFTDGTIMVPCLECEDFTIFDAPEGI